ncbi:MAG: DUF1801 domain-containing protein [Paracoccaceae bacterium]
MKPQGIDAYNQALGATDRAICEGLREIIDAGLAGAESKLWHAHPVWFLAGNPIVGYSRQKAAIRLMFWSGRGFESTRLLAGTGRFMDASAFFTAPDQIDAVEITGWLAQAARVQWDYKNIVRNRGQLNRL